MYHKKEIQGNDPFEASASCIPNLLNQQFKVSQLGSVWSTDITYVYTKEGWFYLATVMDLFSRRIIGWAMAPRMTKALVISALNKAYTIQEPREGLIHPSDQGSQYASIKYQNLLREKGIQSSMSRKGNCYDNACIASFHSIIKKELIYHQNIRTIKPGKKQCLALWRISLLFIILNEYIQR
ncbi:IS3 family transposase [Staphylococcus pseudintermedius]|nr:IS3 family transposase [Staphylococcus pseudintermedius]EGQ4388626.1 IS3 family transposase [Staphylococcus pseudintermedius]POY94080.1 hypothetical protein CVM48_11460 [Staphylococcus pseudintermedius]QIW04172.1 IS3 family transposase [Staphylococcus pseudintermedius]